MALGRATKERSILYLTWHPLLVSPAACTPLTFLACTELLQGLRTLISRCMPLVQLPLQLTNFVPATFSRLLWSLVRSGMFLDLRTQQQVHDAIKVLVSGVPSTPGLFLQFLYACWPDYNFSLTLTNLTPRDVCLQFDGTPPPIYRSTPLNPLLLSFPVSMSLLDPTHPESKVRDARDHSNPCLFVELHSGTGYWAFFHGRLNRDESRYSVIIPTLVDLQFPNSTVVLIAQVSRLGAVCACA